ncbi:ribonucleoside-diphosphate reductase subunit alpha [Candidatus Parcubacteria bacterium]|nr:MAG: ribonucleoside-diphosphate reductase subunit alpha [Candidatus Parcubacteria bacterium]
MFQITSLAGLFLSNNRQINRHYILWYNKGRTTICSKIKIIAPKKIELNKQKHMNNLKIQKRNGDLVTFDKTKINNAITKAFNASKLIPKNSEDLMEKVMIDLNEKFINQDKLLTIENVQDVVEDVLIKLDYHDVAKSYIRYREARKVLRGIQKDKALEDVENIKIITESGKEEDFREDKISVKLLRLANGLSHIDIEKIIKETKRNLYNGIQEQELKKAILNSTRMFTESHYDYSSLAARLLFDELYSDILDKHAEDDLEKLYKENFRKYIENGVSYGILNKELADFNLDSLADSLIPKRDNSFFYLGAQTIKDRYLLRTPDKKPKIFELPQWFWMRVAMGLSLKEEKKNEKAVEFYNVLSQFYFVSSTPTLFNSGTTHSQLSSCYLNTVEDSLTGIFKGYSDVAQVSKWAGGVGTDWTPVRSMGSKIVGTNGDSQGVIPFLKIYNDVAVAVNQGGKRRGALAAYLEVWHSDIEEFVELKKNTGDERRRTHDIHPVTWIPDLFMKRVEANEDWTLFSPNTVPELHEIYGREFEKKYLEYEKDEKLVVRRIKARVLWQKMLTMLYETGHPWITFKDACNVRSPQDHVGVVHGSNLCTEITLNSSKDEIAVCNLGSINMALMIKNGDIDKELLRKTVRTGMRMLDNVVDVNFYPTPETKNSNLAHRPVGLGMMGYQDALYKMGINFDSLENVEFSDRSMEMISYYALEASADLASEKGTYQSYKGSKWDRGILPIDSLDLLEKERGEKIEVDKSSNMDWDSLRATIKEKGMRNSNCMAIAPTATISNIAGSVPSIEPIFKNIYMKENLSGNFLVINRNLIDDLMSKDLWNESILNEIKMRDGSLQGIAQIPEYIRAKYKEAFEIPADWVLETSARRGKWIDQSASTNIFISTTSGKVLSELYTKAWKYGLKTTYYLRTLAASQVSRGGEVKATEKKEFKACSIADPDCEACQ